MGNRECAAIHDAVEVGEDQIATLKERLRADVCTAKDPAGKAPPASTPAPAGQKT